MFILFLVFWLHQCVEVSLPIPLCGNDFCTCNEPSLDIMIVSWFFSNMLPFVFRHLHDKESFLQMSFLAFFILIWV